jgi:seryl-tRNA synthetase
MPTTSLPQLIRELELIASGITNHVAETTPVGLTETQATEFRTYLTNLKVLENEQEKLKGDLKAKTEEMNTQAAARKKLADARKRVKLSVPQAHWVEFGIVDSK